MWHITEDSVAESNMARYGKVELCLVLTNKFVVPENDGSPANKLFIKTKELLVSVLQFLKGDNLVDALEWVSSPIQEKLYSSKCSSLNTALNFIHKR